jgi:hypothetical protein
MRPSQPSHCVHPIAAVAPRFVHKSVHNTARKTSLTSARPSIRCCSPLRVVALSRESRDREADALIGHPGSGYRRRDPRSRGSELLPKVSARSPALFQQQPAIPFFRWKRLRNKPIRAGQTGSTGPISGRWASASETGGGLPADRSRCQPAADPTACNGCCRAVLCRGIRHAWRAVPDWSPIDAGPYGRPQGTSRPGRKPAAGSWTSLVCGPMDQAASCASVDGRRGGDRLPRQARSLVDGGSRYC